MKLLIPKNTKRSKVFIWRQFNKYPAEKSYKLKGTPAEDFTI